MLPLVKRNGTSDTHQGKSMGSKDFFLSSRDGFLVDQ